MRFRSLVLCLILIMVTATTSGASSLAPFTKDDVPPAPDYTKAESWIALPENPNQYPVDIFWSYPTILMDNEHWLMDISSTDLRKKASGTLRKQASVFSNQANLYAPLYRQMNMAALGLPPEKQGELLGYGLDDVWRAFSYYLKHYNQGRPFIIAGHSQGSNLLLNIALKHWGSLGVEKQLVAAYTIGWSITPANLKSNPALTMCESAKQTNCFIAYNTMLDGRQDAAPTRIKGTLVTNPLTWKTSGEFAPAALNKGSKFFFDDGTTQTIARFTSAQVKNSGLVVNPKDPKLVECNIATFPKGVFHVFDYSLFYENLRQNVGERINAFTTK